MTGRLADYANVQVVRNRVSPLSAIWDYSRTDLDYGVTWVSYKVVPSLGFHVVAAVSLPFAGLAGLVFNQLQRKEDHFFDTHTGEFLGVTWNEAAEKLNTKGEEELKAQNFYLAKIYFYQASQTCFSSYENKATFEKNVSDAEKKIEEAKTAEKKRQANEEAWRLYNEGMKFFGKKQYKQALDLFKKACDMFTDDHGGKATMLNNIKLADDKVKEVQEAEAEEQRRIAEEVQNTEAERLNDEGVALWEKMEYAKAKDAFNRAFEKCTKDYKNKKMFLDNRKLAEKKILEIEEAKKAEVQKAEKASKLLDEGKELWDEAWITEKRGDAEKATTMFQAALKKFMECSQLVKDSADRYAQLVRLKIEGNENVNRGLDDEESGNACQQRKEFDSALAKYQSAQSRYQAALENFTQGLKLGDGRFAESKEIVEDMIKVIQQVNLRHLAVEIGQLSLTSNNAKNQQQSQDEERHQNRDEHFETHTLVTDS